MQEVEAYHGGVSHVQEVEAHHGGVGHVQEVEAHHGGLGHVQEVEAHHGGVGHVQKVEAHHVRVVQRQFVLIHQQRECEYLQNLIHMPRSKLATLICNSHLCVIFLAYMYLGSYLFLAVKSYTYIINKCTRPTMNMFFNVNTHMYTLSLRRLSFWEGAWSVL